MTSVKKIKVALLALVAALVIAIPGSAFADDPSYTLTIKSDTTGDKYTAYQVLDGDYADGTLTNIKWAAGVDSAAIINAFKQYDAGFATFAEGKTVGATDVASYLSTAKDDDAVARAFANAAAKGISGATTKADFTEAAAADAQGKYVYTATVSNDGYYVVSQSETGEADNGQDGAFTRFILGVVGKDATVDKKAKADVPTVEKKVLEDRAGADWGDTGDFDFTQVIPYKITGTLPDVYETDYDWYYYCFTDQMSPGLTLDSSSVKVYKNEIKDGNEMTGWTSDVSQVDTKSTLAQHAGKKDTVLKVEFADLKVSNPGLKATDKIIVYYECTYNADAVIGEPGNPNDVKLTYSNNPNKDGEGDKGETPEDRNIVFTYQLDNLKVGEGNDANFLPGAKFVLLNADKTKVAKVTDGKFAGFDDVKMKDGKPDYTGYEMVSGADGKFCIAGIDEGTYVLHETFAPGDYTPAEDMTLVITATTQINADNQGEILTLTLKVNEKDAVNGDKEDGNFTGHVSQTIKNIVATNLPSTGGIGTTIFTIVGIALIVAAAAIMVIRRRNAAAIQ